MGRNSKSRGGGSSGGRSNSGSGSLSRDLRSLDQYLERRHLQRRPIAKDGSCLFRAISEQVLNTRTYIHTRIHAHTLK